MHKRNYRSLYILIIFLIIVSLAGCDKDDIAISLNQDSFNNQNASEIDNQSLESGEVLPDKTDNTIPTITLLPTGTVATDDTEDLTEESFVSVNETVYATTPTPSPKPTPTQKPIDGAKETPSPTPAPVVNGEDNEEAASDDYSFVKTLTTIKDTDKLVCVIGSGTSDCTVSYHKKDRNGKWTQIFLVDGDIGSQGITYHKREGDNKTPAGLYSFTLAFGLKSDPGAFLDYRKITEDDYWIDDVNSPYYNTWVNASDTPGEYSSEHLIEHDPSYNYALNTNYNADNTPGLGSAVFLHCYNGTGTTTGCIAISEQYMKTLVKEVDRGTRILIVPNEEDLSKY
jgi:L,D-peptidoglycan transpeptidase YkuD (ErfK/YbiS/YcfS/YnhG family)